MPRPSRYYPALLLTLLAALLLAQYRYHHPRLAAPILALVPPPYAATKIHLSAATLTLPDLLTQLSRQCAVPVTPLWSLPASAPASQPSQITLPATDFPLSDLPALLAQSTPPSLTAAFDPAALLVGDDTAIHSPERATLVLYPINDLINPGIFSDEPAYVRQNEFEDLLHNFIAPQRAPGASVFSTAWRDHTLLISTTPDIHYKIQYLLHALRQP